MAHPSVPWQDAAISVATHKANVYIDLSGWSPKYFPPQLVRAANGLLQAQGAVRLGLPAAAPRAVDRRLRAARHQARGQAADHEGERDPGAGAAGEERGPGLLAGAPAADLPAEAGDLVRGDDDDPRRVRRTGCAAPPRRWPASGCSAATGSPGRRQPPRRAGDAVRLRAARRDLGAGERPAHRARGAVRARALRREPSSSTAGSTGRTADALRGRAARRPALDRRRAAAGGRRGLPATGSSCSPTPSRCPATSRSPSRTPA